VLSNSSPASSRTTPRRHRDRIVRDRRVVHDILDAALICNLGFVVDGHPAVLPLMFVRLDDEIYVHGSPGGRPLSAARQDGLDVCLTVTSIDGIVLARAAFNHSLNYRSVIVHGLAHEVEDTVLKRLMFNTLIEKVVPGRLTDTRPLTERELTETTVLEIPLNEATAKIRTGGPKDTREDLGLTHWAGVIPVALAIGAPIPTDGPSGDRLPDYLTGERLGTVPWAVGAVPDAR
jgi:nitroimidazol reductase NimA-like FMN-containing flavoprotein (pyridoxamine 5'-phosphate oxidase superfamily)